MSIHTTEANAMIQARRSFISSLLGFLLFWRWGGAWARPKARASAGSDKLADAISLETFGIQPSVSDKIVLDVPETAEDGAIVPVTVESGLPNVATILVFVEKNPTPLAARFDFDQSLDPFVSLRIKMNESCDVVAVAKSGEAYYSTRKKVKVVVGGCG